MDKKNDFSGEVFIPQELRQFLHRNFPAHYGVEIPDDAPIVVSDAMGKSTSHYVPNLSIPAKQSTKQSTTSVASQKASIVKSKKLARTVVSGGQTGSMVSHSLPQIFEKQSGVNIDVVVKKAMTVQPVGEKKRKLRIKEESRFDDDLASKINIKKVDVDSGAKKDQTVQGSKYVPKKKKRIIKITNKEASSKRRKQLFSLNVQSTSNITIPDVTTSALAQSEIRNITIEVEITSPLQQQQQIAEIEKQL